MPFEVEAPMDQTSAPARYPSPNWRGSAEVRMCWLPKQPPVGWLIIQDDMALTWASAAGPDRPAAYAVKEIIQDALQTSLQDRLTCREAWNRVMSKAMFTAPEYVYLPDLGKRLQEEWS